VWGDVTQAGQVRAALEGIDAVVHMAGILPPLAYDNPDLARRVNVGGTRTLVEAMKGEGRGIPLIFTSSVAVFGPTPDACEPISPDSNSPRPRGAYGETKLEAENVIRESGLDYVVLRLTAIMYFTFDTSDFKRIFSVPLENRVEFCHPDDLSLAIRNAIDNFEALRGQTLVVSGGPEQRMLYRDMVGAMLAVMGLPLPPAGKFTREPYYLDWYDTSKSQELLGYQRRTFGDYLRDYSRGLSKRYTALFLPFMRYFASPLFGRLVVKLM
jgi:nucleoside-diphosphate-sugar epimerase